MGTKARTSNISKIATQEGWQGTGNVLLGMVCRVVNSADAVSGTSAILNVLIFVKKKVVSPPVTPANSEAIGTK